MVDLIFPRRGGLGGGAGQEAHLRREEEWLIASHFGVHAICKFIYNNVLFKQSPPLLDTCPLRFHPLL